RPLPGSPLFPYTTLFRSRAGGIGVSWRGSPARPVRGQNGWSWNSPAHRRPAHRKIAAPRNRAPFPQCFRTAMKLLLLDDEVVDRSEEHTSELQSLAYLVC